MTESQIRFLYKTRAVLYGSNISKGVKQILLGVLHTNFIFFLQELCLPLIPAEVYLYNILVLPAIVLLLNVPQLS